MKRILALVLAASLLLTTLLLTSCGNSDLIDKIKNELNDELNDGGNDDDQENGGGNGGNGGGSSETSPRDTARAKLAELGSKSGYEITMKLNQTGSGESVIISGVKGNTAWIYQGTEGGTAVVQQSESLFSLYSFNGEEWVSSSNFVGQDFQELFDTYSAMFTAYIFTAYNYSDTMTKKGTETVAGRLCDQYEKSEGYLSVSSSYSASVDRELGLTMKWKYTTSLGSESATVETEVTSFKTGAQVTVPTFPAPGEDYSDMKGLLGWPTNSYTALIPELPGTVKYSAVQRGQFMAATEGANEANFLAYVSDLEGIGYSGESYETYFYGEKEDGSSINVSFDAEEGTLTVIFLKAE